MHGIKYQNDRSTVDVSRAIRLDIKAAQQRGEMSKRIKFSLRSRSFSGGTSIDIVITSAPFLVLNRARVESDVMNRSHADFPVLPILSSAGQALLDQIEGYARAYQRDDSDSSIDHFSCNFYLSVAFASDLQTEEREMMTQALEVRRAQEVAVGVA